MRERLACAVCFGLGEGPTARAITIGIYMLLATTFSILAAFAAAVWRIEKRRVESDREVSHDPARA